LSKILHMSKRLIIHGRASINAMSAEADAERGNHAMDGRE